MTILVSLYNEKRSHSHLGAGLRAGLPGAADVSPDSTAVRSIPIRIRRMIENEKHSHLRLYG